MQRSAEIAVEHVLRFDRLLCDVSSALIAASSADIPARIEEALRAVVEFFGVDRAGLAERSPDGRGFIPRVTYGRPGAPVVIPVNTVMGEDLPWFIGELIHGRIVRVARLSETPPEAFRERDLALRLGLKAHVTVPVLVQGEWRYLLSVNSFTADTEWPDELFPRLRIMGEMFAHAFEHSRAERERERLYVAAQEAIRIRDDFISVASHELRTPLTSLQLAVQALSRERGGKAEVSARAAQRLLRVIERQVANLDRLVNRLLDFSLVAGGHLALVRSHVDLAEVARSTATQLKEPLRASGSVLEVDAPEPPVVGEWDRARLEQVATNLVANAIKFGNGRPITVVVRAHGEEATFVVRDHGIGIPLAEQERIFGRFERAAPSAHYGGFGLGLFVARTIVEAHGGSIELRSSEGEGATFIVRLPLAHSARA